MRQASERLNEAEMSASTDQQRAYHNASVPHAYNSDIYSAGTEFALCQAIAQLMEAVVGVLTESLTESIKSFYKLRKSYMALESILDMEQKFVQSALSEPPGGSRPPPRVLSDISQTAFGKPRVPSGLSERSAKSEGDAAASPTAGGDGGVTFTPEPDSEVFSNQIDAFIHSGTNLCFGIILLLISMVPPAFSKLLSIVGFRGDKQRGLRMLWQASRFHNLIGAIAALALLAYYNGFVRFCDIKPDVTSEEDRELEGYPQERLTELLGNMRNRFPKSQLWVLEESLMKGANHDLNGALDLIHGSKRSPLKQVEALCVFERSLDAMYLHRYELSSLSFIEVGRNHHLFFFLFQSSCADWNLEKCAELNSWSRSMYYYIAGSCHLVLYREASGLDQPSAEKHAAKATEYFREAPTLAGRKRFLARQLPFDVFVTRKIAKWEALAKEWNVPLVDAVGVDPVEEMIFFWNGHSRMTREELEMSMSKLAWSEGEANKNWAKQGPEEQAILDLLRAAVLRALRRHDVAEEILVKRVLNQNPSLFKAHLKDNWVLPVAHFEMAANLWMERPAYIKEHGPPFYSSPQPSTAERDLEEQKVRECKEHLETVAKWDSYELDARIGLKVTSGREAIQKWETAHSTVL